MTAALALSELQTDALRELCNVCGGRGADALSKMIGERPVLLGVPQELRREDVARLLGGPDAEVVAGRVELGGKLRGELWLLLRERDAAGLSQMLDTSHAGVAVWALYEAANIVASACLNALYALTGLTVIPSVPEVIRGTAEKALARLARTSGEDAPLLCTELTVRGAEVRGRLLFLPHRESVAPLLAAMGLH